jgi:hypothetical protein
MTKSSVESIIEKDINSLNKTQTIYENLIHEYSYFPPSTNKNSIDIFNNITLNLIRIIETKAKLRLMSDRINI